MPDSADPLTVYPFLYTFAPKTTNTVTFTTLPTSNPALTSLTTTLTTQRATLLAALQNLTTSTPEDVLAAFRTYLTHLALLSIDLDKVHVRTSTEGLAQVRLQQSSDLLCSSSPLRHCTATCTWSDVLLVPDSHALPDALFETASVIIAVAVWLANKCALLCSQDAKAHVSVQTYGYLRQAAGMFKSVETTVLPLLGATPSSDCHLAVAAGMSLHCMAEAQSITVLRAVKKGNQPGLIAALALDTATLYRDAHKTLSACAFVNPVTTKLLLYLDYQNHCFTAYQHCFAALVQLEAKEAGKGVRCVQEAAISRAHAAALGASYDAAAPATKARVRSRAEAELDTQLDTITRKVQHANKAYLQHVPKDLPPPPTPQRLVTALPLVWPDIPEDLVKQRLDKAVGNGAAAAGGGGASGRAAAAAGGQPLANGAATTNGTHPTNHHNDNMSNGIATKPSTATTTSPPASSAWWRWLLVIIAFPILLIISLVGVVMWVVLLPVKIVCCPVGCAVQLAWDVVEWVIKAPFRGLLWASGKPWRPVQAPKTEGGNEHAHAV